MYKLIKNEINKQIKKKKNLVMMVFFIIVTCMVNVYCLKDTSKQEQLHNNEVFIQNLNMQLKTSKNDGEKVEIKNKIKEIEKINGQLKFDIDNEKLDWKVVANKKIINIESEIKKLDKDTDKSNIQRLNLEKSRYKHCLENNIEPIEDSSKYKAINKTMSVMWLVTMFFLPIFIVIFAADIISGEYNPMTIRTMLVRPVSKAKIYLSKFISTNIIIIAFFTVVIFINLLIYGLTIGFESPFLLNIVGTRYEENLIKGVSVVENSRYLMPLWKYFLVSLFLEWLYIICSVAFVTMISTITKNSILSMGISFIVCVLLSMSINFILRNASHATRVICSFIFPIFFSGTSIVSGDLSRLLRMPSISITYSAILLLIQAFLFYVIGMLVFKRKNEYV